MAEGYEVEKNTLKAGIAPLMEDGKQARNSGGDPSYELSSSSVEARSGALSVAGKFIEVAKKQVFTENGIDINRASISMRFGTEVLFSAADTNKDGVITQIEAVRGADKLGLDDENVQRILDNFPKEGISKGNITTTLAKYDRKMVEMDTDKNGYLDGDEIKIKYDQGIADRFSMLSAELKSPDSEARDAFTTLPTGAVIGARLGQALPDKIEELDKNKDSAISLNELREHLKQNGLSVLADNLDVKKPHVETEQGFDFPGFGR